MNIFIVRGRLGKKPELKMLPNQTEVANFSIAISQIKNETMWLDVECYKKLALIVTEHLDKGREVLIRGSLNERKWKNKNGDDQKSYILTAQDVHFLDRAKSESQFSDSIPL